jgi:arylformamidase
MAKLAAPWRVKGKRVYRDFSQGELDHQYDARGTATDGQKFRDFLSRESARAREELDCRLDMPYGAGADEVLDVFPAADPGSPIVYFIHGGYWRSSSQRDLDLFASTFVPAGCAYVSVNYSLAPHASIDEIVRQCRAGLRWTYENANDFGGDPDRIHVIGRSAGGHLAGMMLATDWQGDWGLPADVITGATAVSGLFDLEPVRLSNVNEWAQLDKDAAYRNSPVHHLPASGCPLILTWGEAETDEFKRQSDLYRVAWASRGYPCTAFELPGKHHYASMPDLMDRDSAMTRAVFAQIGL